MNEFQINLHLQQRGLKKSDVAKKFAADFHTLSEKYARKVVYGMISGKEWYPVYADWFQANYEITIQKPEWAKAVRERMQLQAA